MISGTQTLFNWSLRADIKSVYPHIVRAGFCGFMLIAILAAWADSASGMAPGLSFFRWICRLNVLLISVSGISYFVSAVTEEKDTGVLALLRLAGVSPLAIVLSKSTSRLISAIMLLLIQLPFTFLAITLGGVTQIQIFAAYLALAAWMCLVANLALLCSVRCETSGRAASLATALLLLFFALGPILDGFASITGVSWISPQLTAACRELHTEQQATSITVRLDQILDVSDANGLLAAQFWRNIAGGVICFVLSVLLFNRYSEPTENNHHGSSASVRRFTIGRTWKLAFSWKDFMFFSGGKTFFFVKLAAYVFLVVGFSWFHKLERPASTVWLSNDLVEVSFTTLVTILSVEILLYSSNALFLESRQRAIPSLRMLPAATPVIFAQKAFAYFIAVCPALFVLIALFVYRPAAILAMGDFTQRVVAWVFGILVSSHLTVLLSLYVRWAALPLALFITSVASPCVLAAALGLTEITERSAQLNGITWGDWFGVVVNFVWLWIFILLPIQMEIVNRWNRLSRD